MQKTNTRYVGAKGMVVSMPSEYECNVNLIRDGDGKNLTGVKDYIKVIHLKECDMPD